MKENNRSQVFAIKDKNDHYYIGYNKWDKQLRKAKLYTSYKHAQQIVDDVRFIEHESYLVKIDIVDLGKVEYGL